MDMYELCKMHVFILLHFCLVRQPRCRQYLLIKLYPEKQIPHSPELLCCIRTWGQYYVIYWWSCGWSHLSSVHLHISLCWTSRGRLQARYICPPAHFPLLNVKGPFTSSINLSTCTFPSVERQGAVHRLDTHIMSTCTFPSVECQGAVHRLDTHIMSTCTFPSVERLGAVHRLDTHIMFTCTFPSVERQGAVHKLDTSVHLHISQRWAVKGQFLHRISIGPIQVLASFFCPVRTPIYHTFFNFSVWPAHSFLPHHFSIHVNQTWSHVRWTHYVPPHALPHGVKTKNETIR